MIKIVFLGTTSSVPTRKRNLPSIFLMYKGERILFDCGEGTQRQLMIKNLKFMRINKIFISHWHADHFAGIMGLIQTMSLENRKQVLYIYGPPKTTEFIEKLLTIGYFTRTFPIKVRDLDVEEIVQGKGYKIYPFKVRHRVPAYGYVFEEEANVRANMKKAAKLGLKTGPLIGKLKKGETITFKGKKIKPEDVLETFPGKKVVYTGDTQYTPSIVKYSKDADLLIADSTFSKDHSDKIEEYQHSTAQQAAKMAKEAGVKQLILTHISRRYQNKEGNISPKTLEKEAKKIFKNSILAKDFMEIRIK
jgi:ribonuclease Z